MTAAENRRRVALAQAERRKMPEPGDSAEMLHAVALYPVNRPIRRGDPPRGRRGNHPWAELVAPESVA